MPENPLPGYARGGLFSAAFAALRASSFEAKSPKRQDPLPLTWAPAAPASRKRSLTSASPGWRWKTTPSRSLKRLPPSARISLFFQCLEKRLSRSPPPCQRRLPVGAYTAAVGAGETGDEEQDRPLKVSGTKGLDLLPPAPPQGRPPEDEEGDIGAQFGRPPKQLFRGRSDTEKTARPEEDRGGVAAAAPETPSHGNALFKLDLQPPPGAHPPQEEVRRLPGQV